MGREVARRPNLSRVQRIKILIFEPSRRLLLQKKSLDMRSENATMTSRREFLSNALGMSLLTASNWPIRAEARSTHGQSDSRTSKSRHTTPEISLRWDVFLAASIPAITSDLPPGQKQRPWPWPARRTACHLGRRDLGSLALRFAQTPRAPNAGLRSAAQCLIKGR